MVIYFEGLSGVGKTTLINNYKSDNDLIIPEFIDKPKDIYSDKLCMLNDESKSKIAYNNNSKLVLVDRSYISTLVYSLTREVLDKNYSSHPLILWLINNLNIKLHKPDLFIMVDAPNEVCIERATKEGRVDSRNFWYSDLDLSRSIYNQLFKVFMPDVKVFKLDGTKPQASNLQTLSEIIDENIINKS
jgi:thymidylate kinase